jgi:hypothetical protein
VKKKRRRSGFDTAAVMGRTARMCGLGMDACPYNDDARTWYGGVTFARAWRRAWMKGWHEYDPR